MNINTAPASHISAVTAIAQNNAVTRASLQNLYAMCQHTLRGEKIVATIKEQIASLLTAQDPATNRTVRVAIATDLKTGYYVQLVEQSIGDPLITIGRKLALEGIDQTNSLRGLRYFNS